MKNKLLFWIDGPLHFCIAHYIQKTYDCDLYAIIDVTNKPKKFFINQDLVKFKKIWFFHDHVKKTHSPDLEYLAKFESKYNIDIWKLAINERIFYRFYNFHKFTDDEILAIEEDACRLFESVIDEVSPDFVLTYLPALHHWELFCELAKARGSKILVLSQPMIGYKCRISDNREAFGSSEIFNETKAIGREFKDLREYLNSFNISKQIKQSLEKNNNPRVKLAKAAFEFLFASSNDHEKTHFTYFGRTKLKVLTHMIVTIIKKRVRERFIQNNMFQSVNFSRPYAYFPLGVDPEANILITAPFFTNQTEMIRNIAKSLPIGYELYVKENPAQVNREWRKISEYKEIIEIPNVKLLHPSVSNEKLIENASLVITIAGSSGFEAAFYEKPSIVFSDVSYAVLPSVHRVKEMEKLPETIRSCLSEKVHVEDLDKFLVIIEKNTFDLDLRGFNTKIQDYFYHGGYLVDTEISSEQMQKFLEENKSILEILSDEHIKKINAK